MLNFDEARFLRIQSGAVELARPIDETIGRLLAAGKENIFFLGTGGAAILMQPAAQLLERSSTFPVYTDLSAELVLNGSRHLGPRSIAVIPSRSGTTKESVEVLAYCKSKGAMVVSLTAHTGTPLAEGADHAFVNFAEDDTSSESFYLQSLLIVLSLMKHRQEYDAYDSVVAELTALPALLIEVKRAFELRAAKLAETIKGASYHIISGAGTTWPEAFYYGMCILEEMQWIRTRPVHASDFFHGTLELVEQGRQPPALQGRGRLPAAGRAHRGLRAGLYRQALGAGHAGDGAARDVGAGARPHLTGPASNGAGAGERPSRGATQPSAHDAPLLQAR